MDGKIILSIYTLKKTILKSYKNTQTNNSAFSSVCCINYGNHYKTLRIQLMALSPLHTSTLHLFLVCPHHLYPRDKKGNL